MLVAKQNFGPLAVILFENGRARHENRRGICASRTRRRFPLRETIDDQQLLSPIQRKIPARKDFRLFAQGCFRNSARLIRRIGALRRRRHLSGRRLLGRLASCQAIAPASRTAFPQRCAVFVSSS